jgi:hypothetical protein
MPADESSPAPATRASARPEPARPAHASRGRRRRYTPLPSRQFFIRHFVRNVAIGSAMVGTALMVGVVGYHVTANLGWLDSLVNASMILGGMGPVDPVRSDPGKWFESFYALFSGVVFIGSVGVMLAPAAKRFLHRFHLDIEADDGVDP